MELRPRMMDCQRLLRPSSFLLHPTICFFSIHFFFISLLPVESVMKLGNETDRLALLAFKHQITEDPNGALASWNHTLHFCEWKGVTCSRRHRGRVTVLNLANQGLVGVTSPSVANLSFLRGIDLGNNSFYGQLPQPIFRLPRLRYVNLNDNSYQGEVPSNLTTQLVQLDLQYNELAGVIPDNLHSLPRLDWLNLQHNKLRGSIPPSLGNLSSLTLLYMGENSLKGSIPDDLGRLAKLQKLNLDSNALSGTIPPSLYNLSSIAILDVADNQLHGILPSDLGFTLPNLEELYVDANRFAGPLPVSLPNASRLAKLAFNSNSFRGSVPGNLGSLYGLTFLTLGGNRLGSKREGNDLTFLNSLINCSSLETVELNDNNFKGVLPNAMANLSAQLTWLSLGGNQISGIIPLGLENLVGLTMLGTEQNSMTGIIPYGIGKLSKLQTLALSENIFSGEIPASLGNLTQLSILSLSFNNLMGNIPLSLENCRNLQDLYLGDNRLSGTIPTQILNLPSLSIGLNLRNNSLTGILPSEVGNLKALGSLDISYNNLYGQISPSLSSCISLEYLYMDHNFFHGSIPASLTTLKGIRELDLSSNNLSGHIPEYLLQFRGLEYLNLSFNDLEGEVAKEGVFQNVSAISLEGNKNLCGGIFELYLPACPVRVRKKHRKSFLVKVIVSTVSAILCLLLTSLTIVAMYWRRKSRKKPLLTSFLDDQMLKVSYAELHKATNGFSLENLIGTGSYGSVYKGTLEINEKIVAVKVLNLQQHGATESFNVECEALRNTRHRNLVKILTSCSSIDYNGNDFKALVFEFMPKGSLEKWMHHDESGQHAMRKLTFIERVNVCIDVASALDYLHHYGHVPIVHRDLKPSNILFDDDMNAHVGDFGLAKLLSEANDNSSKEKTSSSRIKGSIGYVAPEYGMGCKASTQGDVYSYGILLMEIFTGKRPTDNIFKDDLDLYQFTKMALPNQVMEIADPCLLLEVESAYNNNQTRNKIHDCLISLFNIGISCCAESPKERMKMGDVIIEMIAIKDLYLSIRV